MLAIISMFRNDSAVIRCTITNSAGAPFNLNTATAKFTVRRKENEEILIEKHTGDGITFHDEPNGVLDVNINPVDTEDFIGKYVYDIEVTKTGSVYTVVKGVFRVTEDVSYV